MNSLENQDAPTSRALSAPASGNASFPIEDSVGAWVPHGRFVVPPDREGPLSGLVFATKDLYDVAGYPTGAGNPTWLATHPVPDTTNAVVQALLNAGATLAGKTVTDELAYSIQGDNHHYGTPVNSAAPDRVPGGSSSGSAAAVAARLCDFALGTDTGGSTRVPASYCGLWGLRTTHGLLSCQNMVALSPKFDTATWLAHDATVFEKVGAVLLDEEPERRFTRAVVLTDACEQADACFSEPLDRVIKALQGCQNAQGAKLDVTHQRVCATDLEAWRVTYIAASAYDAWQANGEWITTEKPAFGPAVAGRWRIAAGISAQAAGQAFEMQSHIRDKVRRLLGEDGVAVLPSASSIALPRNAAPGLADTVRGNTFRITCIAGLSGLPQVSIPYQTPEGLPVGISLMGPAGSDLALIRLAVAIGRSTGSLGPASDSQGAAGQEIT